MITVLVVVLAVLASVVPRPGYTALAIVAVVVTILVVTVIVVGPASRSAPSSVLIVLLVSAVGRGLVRVIHFIVCVITSWVGCVSTISYVPS